MAIQTCNQQQHLTDVFYGEASLTEALQHHLGTCQSCQVHWGGLSQIQSALEDELAQMTIDFSVNDGLIREAFKEADSRLEKRRNSRQFYLFILVAFSVIGMMFSLVATGNTVLLVYEQVFVTVLALASMPFLIRHRLKRGW